MFENQEIYKFIDSGNSKILPPKSHVANMALPLALGWDAQRCPKQLLFGKTFAMFRRRNYVIRKNKDMARSKYIKREIKHEK